MKYEIEAELRTRAFYAVEASSRQEALDKFASGDAVLEETEYDPKESVPMSIEDEGGVSYDVASQCVTCGEVTHKCSCGVFTGVRYTV